MIVFTKRPSAAYRLTDTFCQSATPNRKVENPVEGFGTTIGAISCRLIPVTGVSVAILASVPALHDASVGLFPLISIQSIMANSEDTVVSSLILLAPATNVTGIQEVVVHVLQVAVFGNATLATT